MSPDDRVPSKRHAVVVVPDRTLNSGERFLPDSATIHHLRRVFRLKAGDIVRVVDRDGVERVAKLCADASLVVGDMLSRKTPSPVAVCLVIGLLKGDRTELALQKVCEAGVAEVRVAVCEHSVARPRDLGLREERLRRVALEAACQSQGGLVPAVSLHTDLAMALLMLPPGPRFRLDETPDTKSLVSQLAAADRVTIAVGPEGSFSSREKALLDEASFLPAGLGPRVLRAETAAMAAVFIVQAILGDMR